MRIRTGVVAAIDLAVAEDGQTLILNVDDENGDHAVVELFPSVAIAVGWQLIHYGNHKTLKEDGDA